MKSATGPACRTMSDNGCSMRCLNAPQFNPYHWDIFCRVIDNFGDAGVCWRLVIDLAQRGERVRLWIDQPELLTQLQGSQPLSALLSEMICVCSWPDETIRFDPEAIADVVIEAFACDPPVNYLEAMQQRSVKPVWINLEYLSAENWVETHHRLPSPQPRYVLTKHFFFPGFTPATGGLIREEWLTASITSVNAATAEDSAAAAAQRIFLFSYEQPLLDQWLDVLASSGCPVQLDVATCPARTHIKTWQSTTTTPGTLTISDAPFVPQTAFDAMLAQHDWLFVRGEDSFVRAQWAGKPLVWQIYPQADDVHFDKLHAFYDRYLNQGVLSTADQAVYKAFVVAWNGGALDGALGNHWQRLVKIYPLLLENARAWRNYLLDQKDLVTQLREFVGLLVK